ncbi:MAG: coproporphyrinogen III oxidase, partial [Actinomyces sp.]|nr:coproporphyrinogen III oxidase [Actinomyces sp.]
MSPAQPDGQPWDPHGLLLPQLTEASVNRPLSIYVHIPFCQVRCGYCDF